MHRVSKFSGWKRKKPMEGQSAARSGRCQKDHYHRSQLEIRVCDELRLREIAKDIKEYFVEVPITLIVNDVNISEYLGRYYADFWVEHNDGTQEIIEAKGIQFQTFRKKWKALEAMYRGDKNMTLRMVTR